MKKTVNAEELLSQLSELIYLYGERAKAEPSKREYYEAAGAGVRAAINKLQDLR
ncbi:hypothetical protein [Paenibacillus sp. MMO-177]|uniref:hypothetical protein n=1 Tax=Paenibacillus sp. MMO-177 TaxID=3081289 RepID=UPI0030163077